MSVLSLPDNLKVRLKYAYPTDAEGVLIPGDVPVWSSSDTSIVTVAPEDASGMTAFATPVVAPGVPGSLGDVAVTASSNLQNGTVDSPAYDITVVASAETTPGTITADAPIPR